MQSNHSSKKTPLMSKYHRLLLPHPIDSFSSGVYFEMSHRQDQSHPTHFRNIAHASIMHMCHW